jgi:hypothetical protein
MRIASVLVLLLAPLPAQNIRGPELGYVVDGEGKLRSILGIPGASHIGKPLREGARQATGNLVLLSDGSALRGAELLAGKWENLLPGAFIDAAKQTLLIVPESGAPWRLQLPSPLAQLRVDISGMRAATLTDNGSLGVWSVGGKAEFHVRARADWSFAFAGETLAVFNPEGSELLTLDRTGSVLSTRTLELEAGTYTLVADADATIVLLSETAAWILPTSGAEVTRIGLPVSCTRPDPILKGKAFLLQQNPAQPLWILEPGAETKLRVVPALAGDEEANR